MRFLFILVILAATLALFNPTEAHFRDFVRERMTDTISDVGRAAGGGLFAFADEAGVLPYAGVIVMAWAGGSLISGVVTGTIVWAAGPAKRFRVGAVLLALSLILMPLLQGMGAAIASVGAYGWMALLARRAVSRLGREFAAGQTAIAR